MNQYLKFGALSIAIAMAFASTGASAASRIDLHNEDIAKINRSNVATAKSAPTGMRHARHAKAINLDAESNLLMRDRTVDQGVHHHRYQQTFRGIPIFGEHVVVNEDANGNVTSLFGRKVAGLAQDIQTNKPRISSAAALFVAKRAGLVDRTQASMTGERTSIGAGKSTSLRITNEKAELMIYIDAAGHARKSYVVSFTASYRSLGGSAMARPTVIVDADSGRVLKKWDNLQTVYQQIGTGPGGNAKTGAYEYGSQGRGFMTVDVYDGGVTCYLRGNGAYTNDAYGRDYGLLHGYTCPRNITRAVNGAYSPLNDAHYFAGVVKDMYKFTTGYAPLGYIPGTLSARLISSNVHVGTNYENAYWDGNQVNFGDGLNYFYPLVSLDVVSHEVSHGFTEISSGLLYDSQSGGMNEAFSDMAGEAAEHYLRGTNDFRVGAEIVKAPGAALRNMANQSEDGRSITHASNFVDGMDPHFSSGVYNKAFYTLATTSGWNVGSAFHVFARANKLYWTPSTDFDQGACGVEQAARDLGANSTGVAQVRAAFTAVGVSCATTTTVLVNSVYGRLAGGTTPIQAAYIPYGTRKLRVEFSGGTGQPILYVRKNAYPDAITQTYDCSASRNSLGGSKCDFFNPTPGSIYYFYLVASTNFTEVRLKASITSL